MNRDLNHFESIDRIISKKRRIRNKLRNIGHKIKLHWLYGIIWHFFMERVADCEECWVTIDEDEFE